MNETNIIKYYRIQTNKEDSIYENRKAVLVELEKGKPCLFVAEFNEAVFGTQWHRILTSIVKNITITEDNIIVETMNTIYTFEPIKVKEEVE